jgi:hypothetical protein
MKDQWPVTGHHLARSALNSLGRCARPSRKKKGAQPIGATGLVRTRLLVRNFLARQRETIFILIGMRQWHTVLLDEKFVRTEFV